MLVRRSSFLFGALLISSCSTAAAQSSISGTGRSIDGDSLMVGDREVRLFGIDAPEFGQTCKRGGQVWRCGAGAADELSKLVTGKQVRCLANDTDEHGRTVARCTVGNIDINRTMVATGYAIAYRHYSFDYVSAEDGAKANRRGLWAGTFEMPSDYRHEEGQRSVEKLVRRVRSSPVVSSLRSSPQPSGGCNIKGNRGSHGRIYHLPGMPYYNQTRAEEMFCTEAEAQAAGYRRAKVR
jgi:endonuclease YncB( thermonuclease family)